MADKSPRQSASKKPERSIKEKRADKKKKQEDKRIIPPATSGK